MTEEGTVGTVVGTTHDESPYRQLNPRKLAPPIEAAKRIIEQDKTRLPLNPVMRFMKKFFGEGF